MSLHKTGKHSCNQVPTMIVSYQSVPVSTTQISTPRSSAMNRRYSFAFSGSDSKSVRPVESDCQPGSDISVQQTRDLCGYPCPPQQQPFGVHKGHYTGKNGICSEEKTAAKALGNIQWSAGHIRTKPLQAHFPFLQYLPYIQSLRQSRSPQKPLNN